MQPTCRTVTVAWWSWPPCGHGPPIRAVPVSAQALRRRRLSGAAVPEGFATRLPPRPCGDRQAIRSGQRLRRLAEALDCRTHHSLAEPLPSAGQGLGVPQPQGARLPALGFHSPDAPKALSLNKMIPDRHQAVWTDLTMMRPRANATKDPKFLFVFSQRSAMRLKRLSLPTSCSMRARARESAFGKKAGRFWADDLTGITGQMLRSRAAERLALAS